MTSNASIRTRLATVLASNFFVIFVPFVVNRRSLG
jgi:hypothetical protein